MRNFEGPGAIAEKSDMRHVNRLAGAVRLGIVLGGLALPASAENDTFVATAGHATARVAQGQLMGFRDRGVYTFRGVPYAKAARFMPPEAPDSWPGVRLA